MCGAGKVGCLQTTPNEGVDLVIKRKDFLMTIGTILLIILILVLLGALPAWPYSRSWGYGPTGILGIILVVVLILVVTGRF